MAINIQVAFDISFNITAIIPCIVLIIIYLILKKDLKYPHYFKLELMLILLIIIFLDFVLIKYNNNEDNNDIEKKLTFVKSYLEIVLSFFLLSFNYLCYSLSKTKKKDSNKSLIIALSLGSWILPIYRLIIHENNDYGINFTFFIINVCVISCIYLLDLIFYILIIVNMCSIKKKDEDNKIYYNKNIKRMTLNFMSHLSLCSFLLYDLIMKYKNHFNDQREILNLLNSLSYNFISFVCFLEGKATDYLKNKFNSCFSFEKLKSNDDDDEEESESDDDDDDDDEDIQIYDENDENFACNS